MIMLEKAREVIRVLRELRHVIPSLGYKMAEDDDCVSLGAMFEDTVHRYSNNVMLVFEARTWTYSQFNREVNQLARVLTDRGVSRGDTVALFMENRAEYALSMLALAKMGASSSLINNSLTGSAIAHCIKATNAKGCIVGAEKAEIFADVLNDLCWTDGEPLLWFADGEMDQRPVWATDARAEMSSKAQTNQEVTRSIKAAETAMYIFTSGTTGMPKAALVSHRKVVATGHGAGRLGFRIKPKDRLYLCLPLYHITGMGPGFCGFISAGGSIVLRRSFSASNFWHDIQEHQANCFVYVGELCRYLTMQQYCREEENNPLEKLMGNGLRPDVWDEFKARFAVSRICEMYGSSEGNVSFFNILNKDRTIGAASSTIALVEYDNENDRIIRDQAGLCVEVPLGEPGLLLGKITDKTRFEGYTDSSETAKKIVRDVLEPGDRWFNTGDLIRQIDVGFALGLKHFQFVDRTGDTFRWRAENVSTNEVAEVLNQHAQVDMANVYGVEVPGAEGRAGMVAFVLEKGRDLDLDAFDELVEAELPSYARPVFLRVQRAMATTGTFKLLKGELREQAYHLDKVGQDEIYVRKPHSTKYERLDAGFYKDIVAGKAGY